MLNKPFNKEYKELTLNRFKDLSTEDFQIIEDFSIKILEEKVQSLIDIWVISVVIKRNRALEQDLNFFEIFDINIQKVFSEVLDIVKNLKGYQLILKV